MLKTLRARLIVSYIAVMLPALLLATLVYLGRAASIRQDDAYRQLSTGLYLVVPQVENVLVGERIRAATDRVGASLLAIGEYVAGGSPQGSGPGPAFSPATRLQVFSATSQVRSDLLQINGALTPGGPAQPRKQLTAAVADIRVQLRTIQAALGAGPTFTPTQQIRADLQQIENPLGPALAALDRQQILQATTGIRAELQNSRFRLLILRPDGNNGLVLLDSLPGAANQAGASLPNLPPALFGDALAAPVQGKLQQGRVTWIYQAAPPSILVSRTGVPAVDPTNSRFFVLLAEPAPGIADVISDFFNRFLFFGLVALGVALVLGWVLARSITRPLAALEAATHEIAAGNYAHQAPVQGSAELRALAADFNAMAARVQRGQQAQRDFLANVSHDLKTPLTSVQGFSQAMIDGTLPNRAAFVEAAGVINGEAQRMARLVGDLVDLVRLQSGETPIHKAPVDVADLLQQTAAGMQPQATARHVVLRVESQALPPVPADADRLRRALANLVDNALRYTPPEGRVTLRAAALPGAVRLSVLDTGAGIPPDELPRLFERFYQVDRSRARGGQGSGLGLAIVREIATAHGGEVGVESAPGAGSEFTITLPAPGGSP